MNNLENNGNGVRLIQIGMTCRSECWSVWDLSVAPFKPSLESVSLANGHLKFIHPRLCVDSFQESVGT